MMIETTIAECADRYSILLLKKERTDLDVDAELDYYKKELDLYPDVWVAVAMLKIVNGCVWDLEASLRKGLEDDIELDEIGRRAIKIRDYNKERINIKNRINEKYGQGFQEIKKDHASE